MMLGVKKTFPTVAAFLLCSSVSSSAQDGCPDTAVDGNTTTTITIHKADGSCQITDNMYAKVNTYYDIDVEVTAAGYCLLYTTPPSCPLSETQYKSIGSALVKQQVPSGTTYWLPLIYPSSSTQYLNTVGPINTTSTGASWFPGSLGQFTIKETTEVRATACHFSTTKYDATPIHVNVLSCRPNFKKDGDYTIHAPIGAIGVYVAMAGAFNAFEAAIANWNTSLSGTGITLSRVPNPCSGSYCINVGEAALPLRCAETSTPNTGGLVSNTQTITLSTGNGITTQHWNIADPTALQRTAAHELGHALGMDHPVSIPDCNSATKSVMLDEMVLNCIGATAGYSLTPNDTLPLTQSTYGGGPQTACGF